MIRNVEPVSVRRLHLAGWAGLLALAILPFTARFLLAHGLTWPCVFKAYTGIPCPTCGGTRALAALSRFEFLEAVRFNPLVILGIAAGLAFGFTSLRLKEKAIWPLFWGALLLNWLYLIYFLPR